MFVKQGPGTLELVSCALPEANIQDPACVCLESVKRKRAENSLELATIVDVARTAAPTVWQDIALTRDKPYAQVPLPDRTGFETSRVGRCEARWPTSQAVGAVCACM